LIKNFSQTKSKIERVYYIDWLRVMAVLLLILFHSARIFDIWDPFYVKNATRSSFLSYSVITVLNQWQIPLLFLLAGASTWFALGIRSGRQYAAERFKRLLLPFLFGILVIVPPQAYLARFQNPGYLDTFLQFLPDYFHIRGDLSGYTGLFTPGHLWFILFLFVFALVALPLLLYLRTDSGRKRISDLATLTEKPGGLLWFILPLVLAGALPDIGGKNPFVYITLFVYGFVLVADGRFQESLDRYRWPALILSLITIAGLILLEVVKLPTPKYSWGDILSFLLRTSNTWFWLIAILGFGRRYLNRTNPFLRYAAQGSYPFYILHQTVIVIIGYFVVQGTESVTVKYLLIVIASLIATTLLYDLMVKRTNLTRYLFGMKPMSKTRAASPSEQPAMNKV
jgi:peptidoglycan/LPS O-acetylase OafA/YrhL